MMAAIVVGMLVTLALAGAASTRGSTGGRFVAVQLAGVISVQITLVLSLQTWISYYADVAILLAIVTLVASILFARFLERWL